MGPTRDRVGASRFVFIRVGSGGELVKAIKRGSDIEVERGRGVGHFVEDTIVILVEADVWVCREHESGISVKVVSLLILVQ